MKPELVRQEIEELTCKIKEAAEAVRVLKKKRKHLENYLNPRPANRKDRLGAISRSLDDSNAQPRILAHAEGGDAT